MSSIIILPAVSPGSPHPLTSPPSASSSSSTLSSGRKKKPKRRSTNSTAGEGRRPAAADVPIAGEAEGEPTTTTTMESPEAGVQVEREGERSDGGHREGEVEDDAECGDEFPSSSSSAALLQQHPEGQPFASSSSASSSSSAAPKRSAPSSVPTAPSSSSSSSSSSSPAAAGGTPGSDVWTRLSHLQLLLDQGLISPPEYERRKQQLVDELTGTRLPSLPIPLLPPSTSKAQQQKSSGLRRRAQPTGPEREIDSIPLTSPSTSASPPAARHFSAHASNNHLLMSPHQLLPRPPPDFSAIPPEPAVLHIFDIETSSWSRETVQVRVEKESFARGSLRVAFHMSGLADIERAERLKYRQKEWERAKKRAKKKGKQPPSPPADAAADAEHAHTYVAKMSIDPYEERESYFQDVVMQHYARAYAIRYNSYAPPKRIEILMAWLLEFTERPGRPLCCAEAFIDGVYRKHNNNFGYVSEEERNTPQAFSHYTYEASGRQILICDIQGVGDRYTDPQIHSYDGVGFGKGNMGERGVDRFIASHRCNAICRYLKLPNLGASSSHDEEGTMPGTRYMSYQSVDVMNIEIRGDRIDPFGRLSSDSPIAGMLTNSGSLGSVSSLILPPLIGQAAQGKGASTGSSAGSRGSRKEMKSPLLVDKKSGSAGKKEYSAARKDSDKDKDEAQSQRCAWCCIL